jgi:hypothetical protein
MTKPKSKLPPGFLTGTDASGRFVVYSSRTGKQYAVEPIWAKTADWGSIDPASKRLTSKKGFKKHLGAVREEDSLVHVGKYFSKVHDLPAGTSPLLAIQAIDAKYPTLEKRA